MLPDDPRRGLSAPAPQAPGAPAPPAPGAPAPQASSSRADPLDPARLSAALAAARALIARVKSEGRHHVAATVLTAEGAYTAASLECVLPRGSICAEAVAIGMAAAAEPMAPAVFSVAVNRRGEVIPPCGFCRELLLDFGPDARIAVAEDAGGALRLSPLRALVPHAYKAHLRLNDPGDA